MATGESTTQQADLRRREESMGELLKELSADFSTLMRQELALAQLELGEKGKRAGTGIGMFGAAGIVSFLALQALTACVIALLATTMKVWIAALIVTAVYVVAGAVLALTGKRELAKATPPVPEQTTQTLKEDAQWAKTQLPSAKK